MARIGGKLTISKDGARLSAKGSWTWNLGADKRESIVGPDGDVNYSEMPQAPFCEGAINVIPGLDVRAILQTTNATVTLELASGHVFVLREAFQTSEGSATTEEGELEVRFDGRSADLSKAA